MSRSGLGDPERQTTSNKDIDESRDDMLALGASHSESRCNLTLQANVAPSPARSEEVETSKAVQEKKGECQCELRQGLGAVKEEGIHPRGTQPSVFIRRLLRYATYQPISLVEEPETALPCYASIEKSLNKA